MLKKTLNRFQLMGSEEAVNAAEKCFSESKAVVKKKNEGKYCSVLAYAESMCQEVAIPEFIHDIEHAVEAALQVDAEIRYGVVMKRGV